DFYYSLMFFKKNISHTKIYWLLRVAYFSTAPTVVFTMAALGFIACYILVHQKFQLYVIRDLLSGLTVLTHGGDISCENYQRDIFLKLKFVVQRYQNSKRYF